MADFDTQKAEREHREVMNEVQRLRDSLTNELNYYWDRAPGSEQEANGNRRELYARLRDLHGSLGRLLDRLY